MKAYLNKEVPLKKGVRTSDQKELAAESRTAPMIAQGNFGQMESEGRAKKFRITKML
jgi:hypothetical protein